MRLKILSCARKDVPSFLSRKMPCLLNIIHLRIIQPNEASKFIFSDSSSIGIPLAKVN